MLNKMQNHTTKKPASTKMMIDTNLIHKSHNKKKLMATILFINCIYNEEKTTTNYSYFEWAFI